MTRRIRDDAERQLACQQLNLILDALDAGVIAVDADGRIVAWSAGAERLYGWTAEEVLGRHARAVSRPMISSESHEQFKRDLVQLGRSHLEMTVDRKDGTAREVEVSVVVIPEEPHRGVRYVGLHRDITERHRAEDALLASRLRFEEVIERVTDAFYALDREWRITYINERAARYAAQLTGEEIAREDLPGRNLFELLPPVTGTLLDDEYRRAVRDQVPVSFEFEYPGDGPWFEVTAYPSADGLSIYFREIGERKLAERRQAIVADLGLRALSGHDPEALLDEACALVGRTLGVELVGVAETLPGGGRLLLRAGVGWDEGEVGHAVGHSGGASLVGETVTSGMPVVSADVNADPRFTPSSLLRRHGVCSAASVVVAGRDEPYAAFAVFSRTPREFTPTDVGFLQAVANVVSTAMERARADQRVADVREEERSRIARDLHDEALQELGEAMTRATDPMIVRRLQTIRQQLRGAIYDLRLGGDEDRPFADRLRMLVGVHAARDGGPPVGLTRDDLPDAALGEIGTQVLRTVGEALTNVRRHAQAQRADVRAWATGGALHVEVVDDGQGFDPHRVPPPAAGRGLQGMDERIALLGGTCEVVSAPGAGTTVRIEVPLALDAPHEAGDVRVLLVEDHAAVREALAHAFEHEAGFRIIGQASSMAQARGMLQGVDVALIDLGLPDGYGADLVQELRRSSPDAQAVVLSASLDRAELARAVACGAAGALHKTARLEEVVDTVRQLRAGRTLLPVDEVVELLQYASRTRERAEQDRRAIESLTPRELEVLQALADGLDAQAAARRFHISVRTQRNHVASILSKLGVHSQLQALVFALRHDLVEIRPEA
jgi:PAS domain S-box-containing protein